MDPLALRTLCHMVVGQVLLLGDSTASASSSEEADDDGLDGDALSASELSDEEGDGEDEWTDTNDDESEPVVPELDDAYQFGGDGQMSEDDSEPLAAA
jgi:hypothetical protein